MSTKYSKAKRGTKRIQEIRTFRKVFTKNNIKEFEFTIKSCVKSWGEDREIDKEIVIHITLLIYVPILLIEAHGLYCKT